MKNIKNIIRKSVAVMLSVLIGLSTVMSYAQDAFASSDTGNSDILNDVIIGESEHGQIAFSEKEGNKASFSVGDTVNLSVTPDDGYELERLSIVDAETGEELTSSTDAQSSIFSFSMPDRAISVNAAFASSHEEKAETSDDSANDTTINEESTDYEINWVLGKDSPKSDPIGTAYINNGIQTRAARSAAGSTCVITPGNKHYYGGWSTSEFAVETQTGEHLGYCAQPNLSTPSGTFTVSVLDNTLLKVILLVSPGGPLYDAHWDNLISCNDDYAMAHAMIGYVYSGSTLGLSNAEVVAIQNAITSIQTNIGTPAEVNNYTLYVAYNNAGQDIVWIEEDEPVQGSLRVDKSYYDMSNLITPSDYPDSLNLTATFGVYSNASCTNLVASVKTNKSGKGTTSTKLDEGTYYVKELTAPTGFAINQDATEVSVPAGKAKVVTIKDRILRARVGVVKKDAKTGTTTPIDGLSLEGAVYGLYANKSCTTKLAQGTTNTSGQFNFDSYVAYGTYYIKEISTPWDYNLDTTVYTVNVNSSVGLYSSDNNYRLKNITITSEDEPKVGKAYIQKVSEIPEITEDNNCYSLAGAKFELTLIETGVTLKEKLVTDKTGKTQTMELPAGKYSVQEIEAPPGFYLNDTPFTITVTEGNTTKIDFINEPMNDPLVIELLKLDAETGGTSALGAASLEGAQFTINYYDGYYTKDDLPKTPKRSWVIETKAFTTSDGSVRYMCILSDYYKVSGDKLYQIDNQVVLPLGTISVEETKAPDGYLLEGAYFKTSEGEIVEGSYVSQIRSSDDSVNLIGGNKYSVSDKIKRGDLKLVKVGDISLERLANVPFKITSTTTGESHTVVTDKNGQIDTASTWNKHSHNTNQGKTSEDGVWFSGSADQEVPVDDSVGALPYDTYLLEEQRCEGNKGYNLLSIEICIYKDSVTVDMGTLTDSSLSIGTTATDELTGTNYSYADEGVTIIDEVSYTGLQKDTTYKLVGTLMSKDGEALLDAAGKAITAETTFTTKVASGTAKVTFTFNASSLAEQDIVVFEELYLEKTKIAEHKDINDEDQTIHFPEIGTSAIDKETTTNVANASKEITIIDTVRYDNLETGKKYTVSGVLMDKSTGKAAVDVKGKSITAETSFTAKEKSGTVDVTFTFNGSNLAGSTLVVFEELKRGDKLYATHKDMNDEAQTIYIPKIKTEATAPESGTKNVLAGSKSNIVDVVSYANLTPGKSYTVKGKLMDQDTGKEILVKDEAVTANATFTAAKASGSVEVTFNFDSSDLAGKTLVVFQELYMDGISVASHTDINDEAQTIYIPEIKTKAIDAQSDTKNALADDEIKIVDTVTYTNLIPGQSYTVQGTLMNRDTGEEILVDEEKVTANATFTAAKSSGSVEVTFIFDGSGLAGQTIVVFEDLFTNDVRVAVHADINDEAQTIFLPELHTEAIDAESDTKNALADEEITIIDTVSYTNLIPGREYTVQGTLMNQETGKEILNRGKKVTAKITFTAEEATGSVEVPFTFNGSGLAGQTIVVFEELYTNDTQVAVHADINDEAQTIYIPEIQTEAIDAESDTKNALADEEITIVDTVSYTNLIPGREYTVQGTLMNKDTGEVILVQDKEVTATAEFTAEEATGSVALTFTFDGSGLAGETIVVFEELYTNEIRIAVHADIDDEAQTIYIPKIQTAARDAQSGTQNAHANDKAVIIDTITYENFIPGKEYKIVGTLQLQDTGKPLSVNKEEIVSEVRFTPENASGTVDVTFKFDASGLENTTIVVFEEVFLDGAAVAVHADIADEQQSIYFPEIGTTATVDGEHSANAQKAITLLDRIEYKNLVAGNEYRVSGVLVDPETGKPIKIEGKQVTAEATFTADESDGFVEVEFVFDASDLGGKSVVVFEKLYAAESNVEIASHEDPEDENQTVKFITPTVTLNGEGTTTLSGSKSTPEGKVTVSNPAKTGDDTAALLRLLGLFFSIALVLGITTGIVMKKRKAKKRNQ